MTPPNHSEPVVKVGSGKVYALFVWIVPLILVFIAGILLGYFYLLPRYFNVENTDTGAADIEALHQQIETIKEKNTKLVAALALTRRSAEIDAGAGKELLITLSDREKEMRELREELNFLKSMVSPEGAKAGIKIRGFVLRALDKPSQYSFKLVLVRADDNGQGKTAEGTVRIRVQGHLAGESKTLDWNEIVAPKTAKLKFSFQFFQRLKGALQFPEGFKPENILVKAEPHGELLPSIQQSYSWNSIFKEENNHVGKK
jgi:hypothetical protein